MAAHKRGFGRTKAQDGFKVFNFNLYKNMKKGLYQIGKIAIPLQSQPQSGLKPMPNFIVFNFFDAQSYMKGETIDLQTGTPIVTEGLQSSYEIVCTEVLPETETKDEEIRKTVLLPSEPLFVPIDLMPCIMSHQRIKANLQVVNLALSQFSFRGNLSDFTLEVDETALDEIISNENI